MALKDIVSYCKDENLVSITVDKLLQLVYGKYFQGKELILEQLTSMLTQDLIEIKTDIYVPNILPQL